MREEQGDAGTGAGWITSILTFHADPHVPCSRLFLSFPKTFFWVSAAGDLLVSVGWICRSPPALEILPGLQPRLHLLMHLLHVPAVRLAGLGRATTISGVFKSSSVCSIISMLHPHAPHSSMCSTGHRPSFLDCDTIFPLVSMMRTQLNGNSCKQVPTWRPQKGLQRRGRMWDVS